MNTLHPMPFEDEDMFDQPEGSDGAKTRASSIIDQCAQTCLIFSLALDSMTDGSGGSFIDLDFFMPTMQRMLFKVWSDLTTALNYADI